MIEILLICFKEIGLPEELGTFIIKFFGPAVKITGHRKEEEDEVNLFS